LWFWRSLRGSGLVAGADRGGGVGRVAPWLILWMRLARVW
jgi:hypothetical protein